MKPNTLLQRLGIKPENWIDSASHFQNTFSMQQEHLLLLRNSEREKIRTDLSRDATWNLLGGLKGKLLRRSREVRLHSPQD